MALCLNYPGLEELILHRRLCPLGDVYRLLTCYSLSLSIGRQATMADSPRSTASHGLQDRMTTPELTLQVEIEQQASTVSRVFSLLFSSL